MSLEFGDIRRWDGARLTTASETLRADLDTLERARDTLELEAIPSSWDGMSRDAAAARRDHLVALLDAQIDAVTDFERIVFAQASVVTRVGDDAADIDTTAGEQQFTISFDGTVTDVAPPQEFDSVRVAENHAAARVAQRDALVTRIEDALADALAADSALVAARPAQVYNTGDGSTLVDPQVEAAWEDMTPAEREAAARAMAEDLAQQMGIDDFEVRIEDLEDPDGDGRDDDPSTNSYGSWNQGDRVLRLDVNDLDDPAVVIDTIAHEMRHADQHQAVDDYNAPWFGHDESIPLPPGSSLDDVRRWDEEFDDYISSGDDRDGDGDDFNDYYDQEVEQDARRYGEGYLDDYHLDDLDEHRE